MLVQKTNRHYLKIQGGKFKKSTLMKNKIEAMQQCMAVPFRAINCLS
jgi:hypothetical protein